MVFFGMSENNNIFSDSIQTGPSVHSYPSARISICASRLIISFKEGSITSIDPIVCFSFFVVEQESISKKIEPASKILCIKTMLRPEDKKKAAQRHCEPFYRFTY